MKKVYLIFLFLIFEIFANESQQLDCQSLGFDRETLLCNQCEGFSEIDNAIYEECLDCCIVESQDTEQFFNAWIDASEHLLFRWDHLSEFIKKYAKDFPNLTLTKNSFYFFPTISIERKEGKIEVIDIRSWRTEDIVKFFKEKLITIEK